jgi:serine/threonine protein kinase
MGRVWKAQDVYGNTVAIKTLKLPDDASTDAVKRFRREAEIMAGLPHRNICRIFEMSEHEGTHYIVMEFVDGLSLAEILHADSKSASRHSSDLPSLIAAARSAKGSSKNATEDSEGGEENSDSAAARTTLALPVEQALGIMEKVCEAVEFAHAHGVLHRDLKPGNILLRGDGEPLVADFGLAKQNGENAGASLSASGNVLGTVENMAPEQAQSSKTVDARADVYSLGTILYQMLTGHRHFQTSGNILSDIQTLQTHSAKSPRSLNPRIDQDLEVIILKCLRTDPEQRYRGVQALLADIRRYQNGEPISARPVTAVDLARRLMRRNKVATTVALASLAIIVTLTAASFWVLSNQLREARTARAQAEQARIEAEAMREKSEKSQRLAEEKQLLAEKKEQEALAEKARAEQQAEAARKAHQEKNAAELAALEERQMREKSSVQMEEERRKRVEADASLRDLKSEIERQSAERELLAQAPEPSPEELARRAAIQAAEQEFTRLESVLSNDFSRSWLAANAKTPDRVLDRIGEAIQNASQALLGDTASFRGWMLKGRLHMAAMEFPTAVDAFAQAKILAPAAAAAPIIPGTMAPATSYELAERLENLARRSRAEFGLTVNPTAAALKRFPDTMDKNAGEIAGFFADRPGMKKNLVPPMNRNPTAPELALALMLKNNWSAPPVVTGGPMPKPMSITLGESGTNLSALDSQPVKNATLNCAGAAAFDSVMELKLESLEVRDAEIGLIAQKAPAAATLRSAAFPNTKLTAPASLSNLRIVEALDLSNTGVTDLTPLARSLKLRRLNLGGLEPESLAPLRSLPLLIDLTISPETARDSSARKEIDRLSRLAYVRTPEDPPRQTVAEFREKYPLE